MTLGRAGSSPAFGTIFRKTKKGLLSRPFFVFVCIACALYLASSPRLYLPIYTSCFPGLVNSLRTLFSLVSAYCNLVEGSS